MSFLLLNHSLDNHKDIVYYYYMMNKSKRLTLLTLHRVRNLLLALISVVEKAQTGEAITVNQLAKCEHQYLNPHLANVPDSALSQFDFEKFKKDGLRQLFQMLQNLEKIMGFRYTTKSVRRYNKK